MFTLIFRNDRNPNDMDTDDNTFYSKNLVSDSIGLLNAIFHTFVEILQGDGQVSEMINIISIMY